MSDYCQAIIGYLVPRRSCTNEPQTQCAKCKTPLCAEHTQLEVAGALCPRCALPASLQGFQLDKELYFSEQDLKDFAENYRQQKGQKGGWVEFT